MPAGRVLARLWLLAFAVRIFLLQSLGRLIFALRGWTFEPLPGDWCEKQVVIGFPHRSLIDTVMAFAGFAIVRQKGHVMVKREVFVWPLSWLLRAVGAIPVDRSAASGIVSQMVAEFASRDTFQLALVPEGTRHGATQLRTGFWHIAKAAKVPIVCWYLDQQSRRTRWVGRIVPGEHLDQDLRRIKQLYAAAGHVITAID
jgi:1-acyl-sn-glycerol-3-phosphate acyltransferase